VSLKLYSTRNYQAWQNGFGVGRLDAGAAATRSRFVRIRRHLRRTAAAYGVLLISLLLTVLAYYYVSQNVEAQNHLRFDETAQLTQQAIERRTKAYLDAMFGVRGLFYASESVTRQEWDNYVEGIEPDKRYDGLQALSYAERVEPDEREAFSRRAQREGLPPFTSTWFPVANTGSISP
jgi:CHASE1-domain containing sensor protein